MRTIYTIGHSTRTIEGFIALLKEQGIGMLVDIRRFQAALDRLVERADHNRQVLMCAEAVPLRCHRQLTADAIMGRGVRALDIVGPGEAREHRVHEAGKVRDDGTICYPASGAQMDLL